MYAIFWGYKFDFAASAIIAFIVTFFDFNKKLFAFFGSILLTTVFLTQISDILYFAESSRHIGYEITDTLTDANSLFMTAYSQHTFITVISMIFALFICLGFYALFKNLPATQLNRWYILKKVLIIIISIFFIRGMFQHIPLHPWQSNEIGHTKLATISLNSIYNISYSLVNKGKKLKQSKLPKISDEIIVQSFKNLYANTGIKNISNINTKPNIILFFSEGWSSNFMASYGYEHITTPFYDELLTKSIRPKFMLANGRRTTEGIFATLTSYQNPLGKTVAKTQLQNFHYDTIVNTFNQNNYTSAFFQGSSKDTSGTGSLVSNLGFQQSYGKRDIKKRIYEENYWGVQDTDLYNFIEQKLNNTIKEPFVLGINGASTHDDQTPKGYNIQQYVKDEKLNKKLNTLHYSDFAMGEFIKNIEAKYPNTIFVLFADHCSGRISDTMKNYMIPFAVYSKKLISPQYHDVVLSQRDIAPTLYDLVFGANTKSEQNFTGKSLLTSQKFFADYFHGGILGWIEHNDIVEINTITNTTKCYVLDNFDRKETTCLPKHTQLYNNALSFTNVSQNLLFKGITNEFKNLRKINEK